MDPIEVVISRAYTLVVQSAPLGTMPAVQVVMRHTDANGDVTYRGSFRVPVEKLPAIIDAMYTAHERMRKAATADRW